MDALKFEKESDTIFHSNSIAQMISGICGISRRQVFNIKDSLLLLEEENPFTLTTLSKDLCLI